MAKEIRTEILIHASPEKVWTVLTQFDQYPNWNPFIKQLEGEVKEGKTIKVFLTPPNSKPMTFNPKVQVFKPYQEFRWLGHLWTPGLFDGQHRFQLINNYDGTTTFIHSEQFSGILVPFLKSMLENQTQKGFEAMNQRLKERCTQAFGS